MPCVQTRVSLVIYEILFPYPLLVWVRIVLGPMIRVERVCHVFGWCYRSRLLPCDFALHYESTTSYILFNSCAVNGTFRFRIMTKFIQLKVTIHLKLLLKYGSENRSSNDYNTTKSHASVLKLLILYSKSEPFMRGTPLR